MTNDEKSQHKEVRERQQLKPVLQGHFDEFIANGKTRLELSDEELIPMQKSFGSGVAQCRQSLEHRARGKRISTPSQHDFATFCGVARNVITLTEARPNKEISLKLILALFSKGVSIDYLLSGQGEPVWNKPEKPEHDEDKLVITYRGITTAIDRKTFDRLALVAFRKDETAAEIIPIPT